MKSVSVSRPNGWLRGSPGSSSWIGAPSLSVPGGSRRCRSRGPRSCRICDGTGGCEGAVGADFAEAYGLVYEALYECAQAASASQRALPWKRSALVSRDLWALPTDHRIDPTAHEQPPAGMHEAHRANCKSIHCCL